MFIIHEEPYKIWKNQEVARVREDYDRRKRKSERASPAAMFYLDGELTASPKREKKERERKKEEETEEGNDYQRTDTVIYVKTNFTDGQKRSFMPVPHGWTKSEMRGKGRVGKGTPRRRTRTRGIAGSLSLSLSAMKD